MKQQLQQLLSLEWMCKGNSRWSWCWARVLVDCLDAGGDVEQVLRGVSVEEVLEEALEGEWELL